MAGQSNAAPIIIKRKKVISGGGHHGGAWKVAYADFVTAMMAFFMLMWLLGATTEKQRKGIADYFNPTIPINRVSGGGDGAFGGESIFTDATFAHNGTGMSAATPGKAQESGGTSGSTEGDANGAEDSELKKLQSALEGRGGESMTMQSLLSHVVTKVTDEGLVIEIFDLDQAPLFEADTVNPNQSLKDITALVSDVIAIAKNRIAVDGYVHSYPVMLIDNPTWDLSASRAQVVRALLEQAGTPDDRIARVSGHADRKPVTADPAAARNNRVEIVLLRKDR
ncbi:MAG: flagellar motor protein MotB [bacterium]